MMISYWCGGDTRVEIVTAKHCLGYLVSLLHASEYFHLPLCASFAHSLNRDENIDS